MKYKVCILAAGAGARMGALAENINKATLPVNSKGIISYIIDKFSPEIEMVIAVGHKKETVIDYLSLAHPERKITIIEIDKFIGPATGPGYSLLQCREYLQCPFILCSADTLVIEDIPEPDKNWFGIAPVKETEKFCTVKIKNDLICQLDDKIKTNNKFAFIGLSGIKDYEDFFSSLQKNTDPIMSEVQVSNGFNKLIEKKLVPIGFTWFDTGSLSNYIETNKSFSGEKVRIDINKGDKFHYLVNDKVIKFYADVEMAARRFERSQSLNGLCPKVERRQGNFFSYPWVSGQLLSNVLNSKVMNDFLQWAKLNVWKESNLNKDEKNRFDDVCKVKYRDSTIKAINDLHRMKGIEDTHNTINGVNVPTLRELLERINWNDICEGKPVNFHGDLRIDNVLVTTDPKSNLQKFLFLDWSADFGTLLNYGDIYYEYAKFYASIILSEQMIREEKFTFDMSGTSIYYNYVTKSELLDGKEDLEAFMKTSNINIQKVKILTSLIFLQGAVEETDPLNLLYYYVGKIKLFKTLKEMGSCS